MFGIFTTALALLVQVNNPLGSLPQSQPTILSSHQMSLDDRYPNKGVSDIFKDNILLSMAYMEGSVSDPKNIDWSSVEKPFHYTFTLKPGQSFAFHDSILSEYQGKVIKTSGAHFNAAEGFKSDGYLFGDGVCHLASLIDWAAKDANLSVYAPTNHDFANIPDVPKAYGVAIYSSPGSSANQMENLYVTNNKNKDVSFVFDYSDDNLAVSVEEN